ncbi:MAG TPA: hypothetical protein VGU01_09390 [Sphingomicrobium sp.]|nr:hypothetical protein [Sphingomicrobium sp.]
MKKFFALSMLMAVPASATSIVNSPVPVQPQLSQTPLKNGGYARCKNPNGCRSPYAPYGQIVAGYGEIDQGVVFDGVTDQEGGAWVQILVVYPMGSANLPFSAIYSRADDWEGVA